MVLSVRLSDDELTALLAEHPNDEGCCGGCFEMAETDYAPVEWPCETVRLATEVRDLRLGIEQAVPQVRHGMTRLHVDPDDWYGRGQRWLARYEEGGIHE